MLPSTLIALFLAGSALSTDHSGFAALFADDEEAVAVRYEAEAREISNWRSQTVGALEPKPVAIAAAWLSADRPIITRCVKLNNYWCIKSARWDGEIGKDAEGHVGFASADHGADAAVTLLRRYYLEFGRKSALEIVRRWAPAECNIATGFGGLGGARRQGHRRNGEGALSGVATGQGRDHIHGLQAVAESPVAFPW